jgi:hypothetical protein
MYKFYYKGSNGGGGSHKQPPPPPSPQATAAQSSTTFSHAAALPSSPALQSQVGGRVDHTNFVVMRSSNAASSSAPTVPHRNGVTVRVKEDEPVAAVESGGVKQKQTPSGSHRVLLKLRRMSGGSSSSSSRPKSVPDASELVDAGGNGVGMSAFAAEIRMGPMTTEISGNCDGNGSSRRMRNSKSMHQERLVDKFVVSTYL